MDVWKAPTCGLLEGPLFLQSPLAGTGPQQRTLTQGPISSGPQQLSRMEQISWGVPVEVPCSPVADDELLAYCGFWLWNCTPLLPTRKLKKQHWNLCRLSIQVQGNARFIVATIILHMCFDACTLVTQLPAFPKQTHRKPNYGCPGKLGSGIFSFQVPNSPTDTALWHQVTWACVQSWWHGILCAM